MANHFAFYQFSLQAKCQPPMRTRSGGSRCTYSWQQGCFEGQQCSRAAQLKHRPCLRGSRHAGWPLRLSVLVLVITLSAPAAAALSPPSSSSANCAEFTSVLAAVRADNGGRLNDTLQLYVQRMILMQAKSESFNMFNTTLPIPLHYRLCRLQTIHCLLCFFFLVFVA